ncbi:hypothetical protein L1F28_07500 [Arthrospira platensis NCB002]|uniref:hypothetical protein n=1 Tax=Limnospira platensis TaxID=118562 RepID=UPI0029776D3C|nr:hypothetical protein [Arthrospira platensis NCB002]
MPERGQLSSCSPFSSLTFAAEHTSGSRSSSQGNGGDRHSRLLVQKVASCLMSVIRVVYKTLARYVSS